ncbi:MAG: hypothetical protein P3A32_06030 [Gemmatimonadota bacterium]|jgi:hypothetical protein|nr:hypothetical protein [Gemmatimonadota bacterium]MDQ8147386.1 hypothetical protein [Gemmatimonadota bacterium]MDQ8149366.1 hypothetical protein [Gemmatimonadota bacterium]MDQ8156236.1 hypothetical protein [Gemmatimonadota bacterium]MDQ8176766.1 hypothetical protein [Gemmatimonadota bacterium]
MRLPRVATLVLSCVVATTLRAQAHEHGSAMRHEPPTATTAPATATETGQSAFAAIAEIVRLLEADPSTDWSKVNLEALRQHLIDMEQVTLRSTVAQSPVPGGAIFSVTGTGRTRDAIRRMAREHGHMVTGVTWTAAETPEGVRVTVRATNADDATAVARIRGLGFIGLLTVGEHHTRHHLMVARGGMMH